MIWAFFVYLVIGVAIPIVFIYNEFVSTGEFELKLDEIPLLCFIVLYWPFVIILVAFGKFGNKSIFKITRKEKK